MLPDQLSFVLQNLAVSLPTLLAGSVGLVVVSIYRQRAASAANTAMWCLIALLLNTIGGAIVMGLIPILAQNGGVRNIQMLFMVVNLGMRIISGVSIVGLVYAIFQDRLSESDKLPELDEWHDRS